MDAERAAVLEFTDVTGRIRQCKVLSARSVATGEDEPLRVVELEVETAEDGAAPLRLTQRSVPRAAGAREPGLYDRLEQEVRIALALRRRFAQAGHPRELARVFGYDLDGDEPFVLFEAFRGDPASHVAGRLVLDELRAFQTGLLRGVRILEQVGVVHRGITPDSVRWDGSGVQLTCFDLAMLAGRRRTPAGRRPWAAPQQRMGKGWAESRDDVWSAGMVIYHVATATPADALDRAPDLSAAEPRTRALLAGVFGERAVDRPAPAELLERLGAVDPLPPPEEAPDPLFEIGGHRFDEMMRQKWGNSYVPPRVPVDPVGRDADEPAPEPAPVTRPSAPPPEPAPAASGGPRSITVAALVVVAVLALALIVMGGLM